MGSKFQKNVEDFICEKCSFRVRGDGYTNHCPKCLWSKHVDVYPGDRKAQCHGLMEPERIEMESGEYIIIHRCMRCGHEKRNKANKNDSMEEIISISSRS